MISKCSCDIGIFLVILPWYKTIYLPYKSILFFVKLILKIFMGKIRDFCLNKEHLIFERHLNADKSLSILRFIRIDKSDKCNWCCSDNFNFNTYLMTFFTSRNNLSLGFIFNDNGIIVFFRCNPYPGFIKISTIINKLFSPYVYKMHCLWFLKWKPVNNGILCYVFLSFKVPSVCYFSSFHIFW